MMCKGDQGRAWHGMYSVDQPRQADQVHTMQELGSPVSRRIPQSGKTDKNCMGNQSMGCGKPWQIGRTVP